MSQIFAWWQHLSFSESGAILLTTFVVLTLIVSSLRRD